jgi:hypothetical protein
MFRARPSRAALTKALFSALAGGASLEQALVVAAESSPEHGDVLRRAAGDVENDSFRKEVIAQLELEPPIAGLLVARARRDRLQEVATIALAAMKPNAPRLQETPLPELYLALASLIAIGISLVISQGPLAQSTAVLWAISASLLSLAASGLAVLRKWPVGSRFELFLALLFPPLLFVDTPRIIERAMRPLLDVRRVLVWLAAGELCGIVPGAVIAALVLDVRSFRELRLLRALDTRLRGTTDARSAAEAWMSTARMPKVLVEIAKRPLPGESSEEATLRLARLVALVKPRVPLEAVLPYVSIICLAIAGYALAASLMIELSKGGLPG